MDRSSGQPKKWCKSPGSEPNVKHHCRRTHSCSLLVVRVCQRDTRVPGLLRYAQRCCVLFVMTPWPADNDDFGNRKSDAPPPRTHNLSAAIGAYTRQQFPPMAAGQHTASHGNWTPNSVAAASAVGLQSFDRRRSFGSLPPPPHSNISFELAMVQAQRQAMEAEQLNIQRMNDAFGRRKSSLSEEMVAEHRYDAIAFERLKKKRRLVDSVKKFLSKRGNSFPMPSLKEEDCEIRIEPMDTFQRAWNGHESRSKLLFPNDDEKQKEYVKRRFMSALGGGRISFSTDKIAV